MSQGLHGIWISGSGPMSIQGPIGTDLPIMLMYENYAVAAAQLRRHWDSVRRDLIDPELYLVDQ